MDFHLKKRNTKFFPFLQNAVKSEFRKYVDVPSKGYCFPIYFSSMKVQLAKNVFKSLKAWASKNVYGMCEAKPCSKFANTNIVPSRSINKLQHFKTKRNFPS